MVNHDDFDGPLGLHQLQPKRLTRCEQRGRTGAMVRGCSPVPTLSPEAPTRMGHPGA